MIIPSDLMFTDNDEWIRVEDNVGAIGITDFAQDQLSDVVFVEILVSEGDTIEQGDSIATIESVKAAADVYAPAGGKVVAVNEDLSDVPETVNSDPYGEAWMVKIDLSDASELDSLLDPEAYQEHVEEQE